MVYKVSTSTVNSLVTELWKQITESVGPLYDLGIIDTWSVVCVVCVCGLIVLKEAILYS